MQNFAPRFAAPQFVQVAPPARKNYRDITNKFDRMGQAMPMPMPPGYAQPPGFFPGGFVPQAVGLQLAEVAAANGGACNVPNQNNAYERVVGLPRVCIDGCDCETVETSVCGPFTLTGIYIAPRVAHHLSITRLQVGCNSILVNCDPIPAELFSCCEIDENVITAPTVDANSPICIELENESKHEVEFKGALKGLLCISCQ